MINTTRLRCLLGWLAMSLPFIVLILALAYGFGMPQSISATYYFSTCITPFMIILGASSILLISYKGYDKQDDIICTLAGIFGLGICLFSCGATELTRVGTFMILTPVSAVLHNVVAIIFFALLAYNSLFLFTKTSGEMTENKKKRNIIFKVCGVGMIGSFALLIPLLLCEVQFGIWLVEAIALEFFGISWLTKANYYSWLWAD